MGILLKKKKDFRIDTFSFLFLVDVLLSNMSYIICKVVALDLKVCFWKKAHHVKYIFPFEKGQGMNIWEGKKKTEGSKS